MASSHTIRKKSSKSLSRLKRYKKRWRYIYIQVTLWQVVVFCCWALKWMALYWCVGYPKVGVRKLHWVIGWTLILLKAAFPEIWSQDMNSSYFPPTFEFSNSFFLMVFAIKMLLDNIHGLLNQLEFKCDHFSGLLLAESQFQNSNVGGENCL